jgi:hypothetical protein
MWGKRNEPAVFFTVDSAASPVLRAPLVRISQPSSPDSRLSG